MKTARDLLLPHDQKLSKTYIDDAPVLIEIKEEKQPRVEDALVVLNKAENLLAKKAADAISQNEYCWQLGMRCSFAFLIPMIAGGALWTGVASKNGDGDQMGGGIALMGVGVLLFIGLLIMVWQDTKEKIPADRFLDLTPEEEVEMGDYVGTLTTVGRSLGVETISVEGSQWTRHNSATLFANARDIKKSLSTRAADLLAIREPTEKCILSSIPSLSNDLAAIIADYAVCPRR